MTNRSRTLVVLIAVLLAGCLLGVTGHQFYTKRFQKPSDNSTTMRIKGSGDRLAKRLQLTAEQELKFKAILEDSRCQITNSSAELESKVEAIRSATNERIAAILNEEQKKRFQQLLSEDKSHKHSAGRTKGKGNREEKQ